MKKAHPLLYSLGTKNERMFYMNAFDKIIGYNSIKNELRQISDTLKSRDSYDRLGIKAPRGLLLYGAPGVGKSLMSSAVIEESGRKVFVCRKDKPNGDFVKEIKATFDKAIENAPSIVYLDDMDKFANSDERHRNTDEYVTVQSCIDEAKDKEIFVLATVNDLYCLPNSLRRAGRFDRVIKVETPHGKDAEQIIAHYLKSKKISGEIDPITIAHIMDGHSCAELETVINEAGLYAGYERAEYITMEHFMKACLHTVFGIGFRNKEKDDECFSTGLSDPSSVYSQIVCHEAGHAVMSEVLCPGSVTLICALRERENGKGGFTACYNDNSKSSLYWDKSRILTFLGGMAAVEQKFGIQDYGSSGDLANALDYVKKFVMAKGLCGFQYYSLVRPSPELQYRQEQVVATEVEKYYHKAKEILSLNAEFFEKVASALSRKGLLSACDLQQIKSECSIIPVSI